jgi:membrane protein
LLLRYTSVWFLMENPDDKGEHLNLDRAELRAVARRPAGGSLGDFFQDLRALLNLRALKAAVAEFQRDDALGLAAQLAFYLILALFPFILVLVSLMGTFGTERFASTILEYFQQVTPQQVYEIIETYTGPYISGDRPAPGLFSLGLVIALWSASGAFAALIAALNKAYDVEETRPFWKVRGIALLMTLGLSVMILISVLLLVLGPGIGSFIAGFFGLSSAFELVWSIARWPVALSLMVLAVALIYYFAPDAGQPFRWITPGGFIGVTLWVLASLGFRLYLSYFNSYDETYGTIGAFIVLLLYLYISSLTILFGAELNATLVRMKEEISGEQILDAEPADEKPDILEEDQQNV